MRRTVRMLRMVTMRRLYSGPGRRHQGSWKGDNWERGEVVMIGLVINLVSQADFLTA